MAKVVAIHEIVRPGEVIKPGKSFTSTGEELAQLKAAGAIKIDNSDAEDVEVKEPTKVEENKPAAQAKGGKNSKTDKDLV